MENTTNCTVYEIFSGVRNGDDIQNAKVIGKGKIFEGEGAVDQLVETLKGLMK